MDAANATTTDDNARRAWIGLLARARPEDLAQRFAALEPLPPHEWRREPQVGLIMARGRAGGTGDAFNLGEMSATRATVRFEDGTEGHACVLGRDKTHAKHAALCDALLQGDAAQRVHETVLEPLRAAEDERKRARARKAAATRVEFFTMARGS
jgi:alpha-D-ribose 1-methylphosphonate 5-triphosphate synthase subunit PhnG